MRLSPATSRFVSPARVEPPAVIDWQTALGLLRDAGAEINRLGPGTSLAEALQLVAETAVRLVSSNPADGAAAVIYTYDAERGAFDSRSRVSAGEGDAPLVGDTPRPNGVGATALARRARVLSYEERGITFHPLKYRAGIRTAACYPLLAVGQPVGALYIDLRTDRRFTDDELLLLDTFVHLAAVAIYNTRQFEGVNRALKRKVDELERLQGAGRLISSRLDLDETLNEILRAALDLTKAEHGSFRLLDKKAGLLRLSAIAPASASPQMRGEGQGGGLAVSEYASVMGWAAKRRQPLLITDLREPPWADIYRPLLPDAEMRSELAVPLLGSGGALEGVLNMESPRLAAFDADDQRLLEALATQAVIAIQEAKLLDAIAAVSEQLIHRTPDDLFALLIERACDLLNVPHAAVWDLEGNDPPTLILRASTGGFPPRYRVPVGGSLLGAAVRTRRPVISPDLRSDPRIQRRELVRQMGWASALIVPLVVRDGALRGAFGVYAAEARAFSDWDTRLLTSLANHAAVALQQAESLAQMKLAEERQAVAETFAVLGDVAANLLHRINNLIGAIPVRLQGLADKRPALAADAYAAASLRDVEASARAAMEAARETLAFMRPLRLRPVRAADCYRAAAARLTIPPHIHLLASGLDDLPPVWAGDEQLRLVFVNLIENAVDAIADRAGRIHVSGRVIAHPPNRGRQWAEIAVADDGPGVPPLTRGKIFEPDFSTKGSFKKLGFGLWWVKSWVQRFGGGIELAEPSPALNGELPAGQGLDGGRGCVFVIRLPLAEPGEGV
jgi:GAF domain-containing protein